MKGLVGREKWGGGLRETTTGAAGGLDLVVGVSRQDIEELGVEPLVNGSVDLVLAVQPEKAPRREVTAAWAN